MQVVKSKSGKIHSRSRIIQLPNGNEKTVREEQYVGETKGELRKLKRAFNNLNLGSDGSNQMSSGLSASMSMHTRKV